MPIAAAIQNALGSSSMIRKMFEEGNQLKKQYGADKVFDFSLGNPDVDPPPAFHEVFVKLAQEDKKGCHGYMPNAGYPEVREALAKKASREQQVSLGGQDIVMAVGAAGGLNTVFKTICNPGDEEGNQLKKQYGADKVFDFSLGNPDVDPPPAFHEVFVKLAQEDKKGCHGYMPTAGFTWRLRCCNGRRGGRRA